MCWRSLIPSHMIATLRKTKKPSRFGLGWGSWWGTFKSGLPLDHTASISNSRRSHTGAVIPASIAGLTRNVWWIRQKLYQAKCRQYAAHRFSHFFENAFVSRVRRRMHMRIVRFWRLYRRRTDLRRVGVTHDWDLTPRASHVEAPESDDPH